MNAKWLLLPLLLVAAESRSQQVPVASEAVEVTVVNVDAIVTDRAGNPVHGLTARDFELFENGVKQEISNFYEVRIEATEGARQPAPAAAPESAEEFRPLRLILMFDEVSTLPASRNRVIESAREFVRKAIRPQDAVMIVRWRNVLTVDLPFTSDLAEIDAALVRLSRDGSVGGELARERAAAVDFILSGVHDTNQPVVSNVPGSTPRSEIEYGTVLGAVERYAAAAAYHSRRFAGALVGLSTSLSGVPGRKVLVVASESLPTQAGSETFRLLDSVKDQLPAGRGKNPLSHIAAWDISRELLDVINAANANGVAIYPIQALASFHSADASTSGDTFQHVHQGGVFNVDATDMGEGFVMLANGTGARAAVGSTNWDAAFAGILSDLRSYYSLGYRPSGPEDGERTLEVKVKRRGTLVRTRRSFTAKSFMTELRDLVSAHLFYPPATNDLGIEVSVGEPAPAEDGRLRLPLEIRLPTNRVLLASEGADLTGSLTVLLGFMKENGAISEIAVQENHFRFPAASRDRRQELTLRIELTTDPGTDRVSIAVLDPRSRATGFAAVSGPGVGTPGSSGGS